MNTKQEYWNKGIIYNIKSRVKNRTLDGKRLIVDLNFTEKIQGYWNGKEFERTKANYVERTDEWTTMSSEALQESGYKKVKGLYDSLIWWGVPVYMKIHGLKKIDLKTICDETGQLVYSQDTSATLHDAMQSNATMEFIKGMGKTTMSAMDTQKIIMIALLGAGAFFGLYIMGVF